MNLKIKINRLYQPEGETQKYASIRDYDIKKALESNGKLEIFCKGETMVVKDLNNYTCNGKVFRSRFGERATYKLFDYKWSPITSKQTKLL